MSASVADAEALLRGDVYRALATGFDYPTAPAAEMLEGLLRDLAAASPEVRAEVPPALLELAATWREERAEAYAGAYLALFDTTGSVASSESAYVRIDRSAIMRDVTAIYSAFGLTSAATHGQPDSIRHQLGFLAMLAYKEWYAAEKGLGEPEAIARDAARMFLGDHLLPWGMRFAARVVEAATLEEYAQLGTALAEWLERERRRFGLPEPATGPVSTPAVDPMSGGCPAAGEASNEG